MRVSRAATLLQLQKQQQQQHQQHQQEHHALHVRVSRSAWEAAFGRENRQQQQEEEGDEELETPREQQHHRHAVLLQGEGRFLGLRVRGLAGMRWGSEGAAGSTGTPGPERTLLVYAWLDDDDGGALSLGDVVQGDRPGTGTPSAPLHVRASALFFRHHGLRPGAAAVAVPLGGSPAGVRRLVLGARSRAAFSWASGEAFAAGLRTLAAGGPPGVLVRRGDPLIVPCLPMMLANGVMGGQGVSGAQAEEGGSGGAGVSGAPVAEGVQGIFGDHGASGTPGTLARLAALSLDLLVLDCGPVLQGTLRPDASLLLADLSEAGQGSRAGSGDGAGLGARPGQGARPGHLAESASGAGARNGAGSRSEEEGTRVNLAVAEDGFGARGFGQMVSPAGAGFADELGHVAESGTNAGLGDGRAGRVNGTGTAYGNDLGNDGAAPPSGLIDFHDITGAAEVSDARAFERAMEVQPVLASDFARLLADLTAHGTALPGDAPGHAASTGPRRTIRCWPNAGLSALLDRDVDSHSCVVVGRQTLGRLGLFHGEWVTLRQRPDADVARSRPADGHHEEDSPLLYPDGTGHRRDGVTEEEAAAAVVVVVPTDDRPAGEKRGGRCARIFGVDARELQRLSLHPRQNDGDDGLVEEALVCPSLIFNACPRPWPITSLKPAGCFFTVERLRGEVPLTSSRSALGCPPIAGSLCVAIVESPQYKTGGNYDNILRKHFETPRLVKAGDVLCIPTRHSADFLSEEKVKGALWWPVLYYQVKSVNLVEGRQDEKQLPGKNGRMKENDEGQPGGQDRSENLCYLVDTKSTNVYLEGSVNAFAPVRLEGAVATDGGHPLWDSDCPPGLTSAVDELTVVALPYVSSSSAALLDGQCSVLLCGPSGAGKTVVVRAVCRRLNLHLAQMSGASLCRETAAAAEARLRSAFSRAAALAPCVLLVKGVEPLGRDSGGKEDARVTHTLRQLLWERQREAGRLPVLVLGTAVSRQGVVPGVQSCFLHELRVDRPDEGSRAAILQALAHASPLGPDVSLARLAQHTAGFVLGDLCALLSGACRAAYARVAQACSEHGFLSPEEERALCELGVCVTADDFSSALDELQAKHAHAVGAPEIPRVHWDDVGGLSDVKRELLDLVQLPRRLQGLRSGSGLRRSGLLLFGPPGTGKTLLAKALATECSMTFLSVKGPELINMYVGQSEENVRDVFARARSAAPCVVFFDELDSLAPNRGRSGDSGGVTDRVVSQLLAELDGMHTSGDVFVVGATNRPDLLDPALLRPGRFDKMLYVGVSEDRAAQLRVLRAVTRKLTLGGDVSLEALVEAAPPCLTGADMYALASHAMMAAVKRKIALIERAEDTEESELVVEDGDFRAALGTLQPSVTEEELRQYEALRQRHTPASRR
ncbi:peroxisome biogenesis factor 6 isoform X1 [Petromyzon marinus]|uniref:peroxisome biogenesis factor 6 isoform X1 n=1 Tax=Petromyzon marinus TaxID=7757 RepID=UPI003F6E463A